MMLSWMDLKAKKPSLKTSEKNFLKLITAMRFH